MICYIFPRTAVSNRLIAAKLKIDLKYRCYENFKPVHPSIICQALAYLKINEDKNSMKIFQLQMVFQVRECSGFLILLKFK